MAAFPTWCSAALEMSKMFPMRIAAISVALTLTIGLQAIHGQSASARSRTPQPNPTRQILQFDVVSIKPTPAGDDKMLIQQPPGGTSFHGAPIRMVLQTAFGVDDNSIIGAPSWVNTNRYDIEAKVAPEDAARLDKLNGAERNAMLLQLLTERSNLKFHHETRERPVYALVVAKGGPRLTKGLPLPPGGIKPADPDHPEDPANEHFKVMTLPGHIEADSIPMDILADQLSRMQILGRIVVNKTGLAGNYSFTLRWTPDNAPFPMMHDADGLAAATAPDPTPSSLFTALQEQLGLKLETTKVPVETIVVDSVARPTEN
jgi:bla regulator protein blaR1